MYYPLTVACIFFLTRFEFVFTFLDGTPPHTHTHTPDQKAIQATGMARGVPDGAQVVRMLNTKN